MNKRLFIAPYVLMRYESVLDTYFFYNAKTQAFWKTDALTGSIVRSLDGTISEEEVYQILASKTPEISTERIKEHFSEIFQFLLKEDFLHAKN